MKKYVLFSKSDQKKLAQFYKSIDENDFIEIESISQTLIDLYSDNSLLFNSSKFRDIFESLKLRKLLKHCRIFNVGKLFQKIN